MQTYIKRQSGFETDRNKLTRKPPHICSIKSRAGGDRVKGEQEKVSFITSSSTRILHFDACSVKLRGIFQKNGLYACVCVCVCTVKCSAFILHSPDKVQLNHQTEGSSPPSLQLVQVRGTRIL